MKRLSKVLLSTFIAVTVLFITPIIFTNSNYSYTVNAATKVSLNKTRKTLYAGDTYKLKIEGTSKKVKWSSSNKKIATVNSKGKVKAKKDGKVVITAKVSGKNYKCTIKVKKNYIKAGKYKLTFGKYKSTLPKYDICGGTYTINGNGTYSYVNTWKDYSGKKSTKKHSGKYKIEYYKDYMGEVDKNKYVIAFYAKKSNDKYDEFFIKKGYSLDCYNIVGNNKLSAEQYLNTFKLKK
ncbi:MAG: Ig-like domain-containing protein [Clostridia bacterium]|nr:Ig-like domain-containing protein [Clostridia bacterium]